jgi:hypothetical protein
MRREGIDAAKIVQPVSAEAQIVRVEQNPTIHLLLNRLYSRQLGETYK